MHTILLGCLFSATALPSADDVVPPRGWISGENLENQTQSQLNQFLEVAKDLKAKAGTPGAAIAVVVNGRLIYRGGLGFADTKKNAPVQPNTLFAAGSCTKAMTGFAAAQLASEARFDWDDRVTHHLPNFRMSDQYVTRNVRLRDMFTHTTGLGRHDQLWLRGNLRRDQILAKLPHLELSCGLRERYEYNNIMFTLAGLAVARAGETDWDQLIRTRVFKVLSMNASLTTYDQFVKSPNRSIGYDPGGTRVLPHRRIDVVGPAGSVTSTIEDMSHWLLALVNEGRFGGKQVIDAESLKYITSPQATIVATDRVFYGIGWEVVTEQDRKVFQHGGGIDGQNCYVKVLPDDRFGIVIFANHQSDFDDQLAKYASAIFVHGDFKRDKDAESSMVARRDRHRVTDDEGAPTGTTGPAKPLTLRVSKKHPCRHSPEEYAGQFRHGAYGAITITQSEAGQFKFAMDDITGFLRHRGYEYFEVHTEPNQPRGAAEVGFRTSESGDVSALTIKLGFGSPDLVFRKVVADLGTQRAATRPTPTTSRSLRRPNAMRSNKLDITYRIGDAWPAAWEIMPDVSPDKLEVSCKNGQSTKVTFESDIDKRTFVVNAGETLLFDIVLPDGQVAKTKIIGQ